MLILGVASVALMFVDHRQHHLENIRAGISFVLYPLQYVANLPSSVFRWTGESMAARNELVDENRRLKEERLLLEARVQRYETVVAENERLRTLLHSSSRVGERALIGELMAVDLDPFQHRVLINKGGRDGVFVGQPVLDAHGVMGQVIAVSYATDTTMLITDPSHAIPAQVNRSGLRVVAMGTGESHRLEIPHIPTNADIQVGDLLVTSGLGGNFPPGYPVGHVTSIERDPSEPYLVITAEPTAHLERSREALLVWPGETTLTTDAGVAAPAAAEPGNAAAAVPASATAALPPEAPKPAVGNRPIGQTPAAGGAPAANAAHAAPAAAAKPAGQTPAVHAAPAAAAKPAAAPEPPANAKPRTAPAHPPVRAPRLSKPPRAANP